MSLAPRYRKRYHQIKGAYEKAINSPVTKNALNATRKAVANKLDPEPRMKEVKDLPRPPHQRKTARRPRPYLRARRRLIRLRPTKRPVIELAASLLKGDEIGEKRVIGLLVIGGAHAA